ncbi:MAG: type II toxin-antitoxin system prevent-host-death family antitoxin [Candidatus Zambryskibacteria bacterium]|nr:type II toxin-antitoxin system prevent-host-death family antitoxin [Candidatus Zambryskibacteria bacterium]
MNKIIGLKDLRENTEAFIDKVKKGHSFVVVRKSKPVFKLSPVDEWGDEGIWEQVIDFREINPKGLPIKDVLASLKRLRNHE